MKKYRIIRRTCQQNNIIEEPLTFVFAKSAVKAVSRYCSGKNLHPFEAHVDKDGFCFKSVTYQAYEVTA